MVATLNMVSKVFSLQVIFVSLYTFIIYGNYSHVFNIFFCGSTVHIVTWSPRL